MNKEDTLVHPHPGSVPTQELVWPAVNSHTSNKIQQTKGSSSPQLANVLPSTQPSQSSVPPRTTPAPVSQVRVVTRPAVGGQKQIIVQFNHPSGDPHFQGVNVYLKRAGAQPYQISGGAQSPVKFQVPVHDAPHVVHVTSFGPWGETNILTSPSHPVNLR